MSYTTAVSPRPTVSRIGWRNSPGPSPRRPITAAWRPDESNTRRRGTDGSMTQTRRRESMATSRTSLNPLESDSPRSSSRRASRSVAPPARASVNLTFDMGVGTWPAPCRAVQTTPQSTPIASRPRTTQISMSSNARRVLETTPSGVSRWTITPRLQWVRRRAPDATSRPGRSLAVQTTRAESPTVTQVGSNREPSGDRIDETPREARASSSSSYSGGVHQFPVNSHPQPGL